ncbi:hypothetical protein G210_0291, partial [Candida maltosa Xu316]
MLLYRNFFAISLLLINFVAAIDITANRINYGTISIPCEVLTIYTNNYWSIINNACTNFVYDVNIQSNAMLFVTTNSTSVALSFAAGTCSTKVNNNGIIAVSALPVNVCSSYNLAGQYFTNNGELYFASQGKVGDTMLVTSLNVLNNGLMNFYHSQRNAAYVTIGDACTTTLQNQGQICFRNHTYMQTTPINGTGCITATAGGAIYIQNQNQVINTTQSFYLHGSTASLTVLPVKDNILYNVYGYGNGNFIGLTTTLSSNKYPAYAYDSDAGILSLASPSYRVNFNIGQGYDPSLFQIITKTITPVPSCNMATVIYTGPVPARDLPPTCQIECKAPPEYPFDNNYPMTSEYTTTWTTTNTDGSDLTQSGVVSSIGTSGTTVTTFPPPSTEYTSTWTTTDSDGNETTQSGVVTANESMTSTLTTFPGPTTYTTKWYTTGPDGELTTQSGLVSKEGSSTTTLTTYPGPSTEYTTTWTTTNSNGDEITQSGLVTHNDDTTSTLTTFPGPSTEYTTTWTTTDSDGNETTESGLVTKNDDTTSTLTTFSGLTSYTTSWTTTNSNGDETTQSGIVSQEGTETSTVTTFPGPGTEYTTSWTTTDSDGNPTTQS